MSRPRKPYGPSPPGRLLATMIKVVAAELSDQARLSRGKRYWADDAVIDIVVGHGAVTAEIQGSRREPYVVTLEAAGGTGVPSKRELWVQCTCPDDAGTGTDACKHAVAALFALSDEVAIEPELVDRWRAGRRAARSADPDPGDGRPPPPPPSTAIAVEDTGDDDDDGDDDGDDRPLADVVELRPVVRDAASDALAALLRAPAGVLAGDLPAPDSIEHPPIADRLLADALADALDQLHLRWE